MGDYLIGYAVEDAEGLYHMRGNTLEWVEPQDENAHVEIVVRNAVDGRFVPNLTVYATLIDRAGTRGRHAPAAVPMAPVDLSLRPELAGAG